MYRRLTVLSVLGVLALGGGYWAMHRGGTAAPPPNARNQRPQEVAVVTAEAKSGAMALYRRTIGWVEPVAQVAVKSRLDSQIATQAVADGQFVKAGDLLFTLDDRELQAQLAKDQATLARDQALQKRAQGDLERNRELLNRGSTSPQAVDQSTADAASTAAAVQADEASIHLDQTRLGYTRIVAPISGRVGSVAVTPGNVVHANDSGAGLVTITEVSPVRVAFPIPERDLASIKARLAHGTPPKVRVYRSGASTALAEGEVTFLDSAVNTASGTITVKAQFSNADEALWPGMALDVEVETNVLDNAVMVPTVAIQPGQAGSFAFVVGQNQTAEIRDVTVVASRGDTTAVKGINAGEQVVIDGQARLYKGAHVRTPPAKQAATS